MNYLIGYLIISIILMVIFVEINKEVLYKQYLDKLIDQNNIWTDQVLWTHIYKDNKDLFFKYACGYGAVCTNLF